MIQNDQQLQTTQQRIVEFQQILAQLRVQSRPDEYPLVSSTYVAEVEKMQQEVLDYLKRHATEPVPAETT